MKLAYADPPYCGCAKLYKDEFDYAGEVDHVQLIERLQAEFDGWVLHSAATPHAISILAPLVVSLGARWMVWVKSFAAFKRNVSVAYAWEPVIVKPVRKPVVTKRIVMRDYIVCPITMKKGLTGVKPEPVCHWAFEVAGCEPTDTMSDLYPGTGAVSVAWESWKRSIVGSTEGLEDIL